MIKVYGYDVRHFATEIPFTSWIFPGGEVGVKLSEPTKLRDAKFVSVQIRCVNQKVTSDDFMIIANLKEAISRLNNVDIDLYIPYLPYARQDRACHVGESFALFVFMQMLATLNFNKVIVVDVHSEVSQELASYNEINLVTLEQPSANFEMKDSDGNQKYQGVIAPDAGAVDRATNFAKKHNLPVVTLDKTRKDGKVTYSTTATLNGHWIVVDDICDGGATFIALAEALKSQTPDLKLSLYVTHGIFSKGKTELRKHYESMDCYNVFIKGD